MSLRFSKVRTENRLRRMKGERMLRGEEGTKEGWKDVKKRGGMEEGCKDVKKR